MLGHVASRFALAILAFLSVAVLTCERADAQGTAVAWGYNAYGQCDIPEPIDGFVALCGGSLRTIGLKADSSIAVWGRDEDQSHTVPLPNTGFVAIAAGYYHNLALKTDGSIVAWGNNDNGRCDVPEPNASFVAVAGGYEHSVGLKADGSIVAWGKNDAGQCTVPEPNMGFVAIAAGYQNTLGLMADGAIIAWGGNGFGQREVPEPNAGFVAVATCGTQDAAHTLGLKANGSIVAWGCNDHGECNVPYPNAGFVAIALGYAHSMALKSDGSILAWGINAFGQCDIPEPNSGFMAMGGAYFHSLALRGELFRVALADVSTDQGGWLSIAWRKHAFDDTTSTVVTAYDVQRFGIDWEDQATVVATQADSYTVEVATPDVLAVGQPEPFSLYRVLARTADPEVFYASLPDSGYSIDNLPPPAPVLNVYDTESSRVLVWQNPALPDFAETCLYRGETPGFTPGDPLQCGTGVVYQESHLIWYAYKARSSDIHGNLSEWSNEVVGQYPTDVPGAQVTQLRLYPNQPNPFNPKTMIRFDLPAAGAVRLAVYDLAGRLVKVLVEGEIPAGSHEAVWDGRDASGRAVPSGSYLARLVAGGRVEGVRLSLVR